MLRVAGEDPDDRRLSLLAFALAAPHSHSEPRAGVSPLATALPAST